jgi:hypothetical protein
MESTVAKITMSITILLLLAAVISHSISGKILFLM